MSVSKAPDVSFLRADGSAVRLSELIGKKTLVLFFYPKDDTTGCTLEACAFRDAHQDFLDAGAEVIGVSADDADSHEAFKSKHKLPYTLLTDPKGAAAKGFGVKKVLGFIAGRVTFIIDRNGNIVDQFDSMLKFDEHVAVALKQVRQLEAAAA
ncbi:MAG: peroxiredoxin [Archangium sp.]|nr:peroxiredoxin [Archangium sp.]